MSFWSSWNSFLRSFSGRTSLTHKRREHILRRHRRTFLESLENRQLMTGVPPVIGGLGTTTPTYNENDWLLALPTGSATVTDSDSASFAGGKLTATITGNPQADDVLWMKWGGTPVTISSTPVANTLVYNSQNIGTLSGGSGGVPLTATLNSNATPAATAAILKQLAYRNAGDDPGALTRTIRFQVTDNNGNLSNTPTVTVAVNPINDVPVITGVSGSTGYVEGEWLTPLALTAAEVADPDFHGGTLTATISANAQADDRLGIRWGGGGSISIAGNVISYNSVAVGTFSGGEGSAPLVIALNSSSTATAARDILRQISYRNNGNNPGSLTRTISVTLSDGPGSDSGTVSVTVTPTVPIIGGIGSAITFSEDGSPVLLFPTATVTDPNFYSYDGGSIVVSYLSGRGGSDRLDVINTSLITVDTAAKTLSYGGAVFATYSGEGWSPQLTISFNSASRRASAEAALQAIAFSNTNYTDPSTNDRVLKVQLSDASGGTWDDQTVHITAVNDPPVAVADSYAVVANTPYTASAAQGVLANDSDPDSQLVPSVVTQPAHGTLQFAADGSFVYTPDTGFIGDDGFTYKLTDGAFEVPGSVGIGVGSGHGSAAGSGSLWIIGEEQHENVNGGFWLGRSGNVSGPMEVDYWLSDGTATGGFDFVAVPASDPVRVSLPAGESEIWIEVEHIDDTLAEPTEGYGIHAADANSSASATGVGYILWSDSSTASVNTPPVAQDDYYSVPTNGGFTVSAPGVLLNDTDANNDPLTAVVTVQPQNGRLTLDSSGRLSYSPNNGFSGVDTFKYKANDGSALSNEATATIFVNSGSTVVSLSVTQTSASEEGSEPGTFLISRTGSTAEDLWVYVSYGGTALGPTVGGADYTTDSIRSAVIPAGASSVAIDIVPYDDDVFDEGAETVVMSLEAGSYVISDSQSASLSIEDNDLTVAPGGPPEMAVSLFGVADAYENGNLGRFEIRRYSTADSLTVNVEAVVRNVPESADSSDYQTSIPLGEVSFLPGQSVIPIDVTAISDSEVEGIEELVFRISLVGSSGTTGAIGPGFWILEELGMILLDETPPAPGDMWKQDRHDPSIYVAQQDGATLRQLASLVSKDEEDWTVIWPLAGGNAFKNWGDYPTAKRGARADVDNLLEEDGKDVYLKQKRVGDDYIAAMDKFVAGNGISRTAEFVNPGERGQTTIERLKQISGEGKTPIGTLYIVRHWDGSAIASEDLVAAFNAVASADDNTNTLELARQRIGPRRGWFTRNAQVFFIACVCDDATETFASVALRDQSDPAGVGPAIATGNEYRVSAYIAPDGTRLASVDTDNDTIGLPDDADDPRSTDLDEFLGFDGWHTFNGGQ